MKKFFWFLLKIFDDNRGYFTPIQERFCVGQQCEISRHKTINNIFNIGDKVKVIDIARYDYLVENEKGYRCIVYSFELIKINNDER